jgi:hypothetical protein
MAQRRFGATPSDGGSAHGARRSAFDAGDGWDESSPICQLRRLYTHVGSEPVPSALKARLQRLKN